MLVAVVDAAGTVLMWLFENDVGRSEIHNLWDAFFFTTVQLLTVSSQMPNPVTTGGRIVDILLELTALFLVSGIAGVFASFFLNLGRERDVASGSYNAAMEPLYKPEGVEERWQRTWEEEGLYRAGAGKRRDETFVICVPPPNVTGALHMGHALNGSIQDLLIRWHRMQGFDTLWQPGYDHAGIATQNVVEKQLVQEGTLAQGARPRSVRASASGSTSTPRGRRSWASSGASVPRSITAASGSRWTTPTSRP